MVQRRRIQQMVSILLSVGMLTILLPYPLSAGGWAIVTLDELPDTIIANQPISVGFTIRQHGQTLVALGEPGPTIEARNRLTGETLAVDAIDHGFIGHYQATVIFPQAGLWEWRITTNPFGTNATMPTLLVLPSKMENSPISPLEQTVHWLAWWREAIAQGAPITAATQIAPAERALVWQGQALFLAKGCTSCHLHEAVHGEWSTQIGPNLTGYDKSVAFLELWLADPSVVKTTTMMPNLDLDGAEIAALSAFLTRK